MKSCDRIYRPTRPTAEIAATGKPAANSTKIVVATSSDVPKPMVEAKLDDTKSK